MEVIEHTLDTVPDALLSMLVEWALAELDRGLAS